MLLIQIMIHMVLNPCSSNQVVFQHCAFKNAMPLNRVFHNNVYTAISTKCEHKKLKGKLVGSMFCIIYLLEGVDVHFTSLLLRLKPGSGVVETASQWLPVS